MDELRTGYELPAIVGDPETYTVSAADLRLDPLATACAETRTAVVVGAPTRDPESGGLLGLGICWDSSYPEHARAAALDGCQAYLVGAMFGRGRGAHKLATVCPARALDNAGYVVVANHSGPSGPYHGCGGSAVWNPDGTLLVDAGNADPGLAVDRLDPEVLASARAGDLVLVDPSLSAPVRPRSGATLD